MIDRLARRSARWSTRRSARTASRSLPDWTDSVVILTGTSALEDSDSHSDVATATLADPLSPARLPSRTRPVAGWLAPVAAVLAALATVVSLLWWQHRSRVIMRSTEAPAAAADAAGCPTSDRCELQFDVLQPIGAAARRLFPYAAVLSSVSVTDAGSGRTVQTTIVLSETSGIVVSASAQCIPGGGAVPSRTAALPAYGPAQADFVVAGRPGCSVAVAAQVPRAVPVPVAALQRLAEDPAAQLVP